MQTDDPNITAGTSFAAEFEFEISGDMIFLSHSESVRMFARAFARAHIPVWHSQGFNPRPKISLPFPRPVGVESDQELLVTKINGEPSGDLAGQLADQMPKGVSIKGMRVCSDGTSRGAKEVGYLFALSERVDREQLGKKIEQIMGSGELIIERDKTGRWGKGVDVREFIEEMSLEAAGLVIKCKVTDAGTVRVDELMGLLELPQEMLARPVKRQNIVYRRA